MVQTSYISDTDYRTGQASQFTSFQSELTQAYAPQPQRTPPSQESFKFRDMIDIVNPLHHIPLIGGLYREITNDQIHPASQIIGGSIYGGPVGAVTGTANAITQINTGRDLSAHAFDFFT